MKSVDPLLSIPFSRIQDDQRGTSSQKGVFFSAIVCVCVGGIVELKGLSVLFAYSFPL